MPSNSRHHAKALTIINLKGGVGKTHTTWLLTGVCQERGIKCLAVDLDQQGNLSSNLARDPDCQHGTKSLFDLGADLDIANVICPTQFSHVDLVAAGPSLQPFDLPDQDEWERHDLHLSLVDLVEAVRDKYDYILFDCPTKLSLTGFAALTASDFAIVPLEPADWGAQGIVQVTEAIEDVRRRHNPRLRLLGYVVSRLKQRRKYHHLYCEELHRHFGDKAFDTAVPDLAGYEQAVTHAIPPNLRRPTSREAVIARRLFEEVEKRVRQNTDGGTAGRGASLLCSEVTAV